MELSIIIVNWNTKDYLRDCLASIFKNTKGVSFEVIVLDNNSSDGSSEMVKDKFPHAKLIASNVNTGFARGNNIAYKISGGDYIAFLNPDTVVYPNTFETTVTYLRTHPRVGAVSCKFLNYDGSFQRQFYRRFPTFPTVFFYFTILGAFIDKNLLKRKYEDIYFYKDKDFDKIEIIDQPGATFMVIPRSVLEKIGGFDEKFPIFFNDVDLCKRIWKIGLEIHFLHDISITHYGGRGIKKLGWAANWYFLVGCYRYFKKYNGIFCASLVFFLLLINLFVSTIVRIISKYLFDIKEYGFLKANKKAVEFILKNIILPKNWTEV